MDSPNRKSNVFSIDGLRDLRESFEIEARKAGFKSRDEQLAHIEREEQEAASRAALAERAHKEPIRRANLCKTVVGRVPDEVLERIESGDVTLKATKAWRAVQGWLKGSKPILVLGGGTGVGKTVASIRAMVEHGGRAQFLRAVQIGAHYERWTSDRESHVVPLDITCAFLVVDDLGLESLQDRRSMVALEEIMDARQSMSRRTIFTTNLTAAQIGERYSDRIRSRLNESALVGTVDDIDHRRTR